mmetsp:Transcript_52283/g.92243  ORF Transcript_52283/g.92243 Transcript_52283/m.92243 type:complete len:117 (-) Transcript_52283:60-410(-)
MSSTFVCSMYARASHSTFRSSATISSSSIGRLPKDIGAHSAGHRKERAHHYHTSRLLSFPAHSPRSTPTPRISTAQWPAPHRGEPAVQEQMSVQEKMSAIRRLPALGAPCARRPRE